MSEYHFKKWPFPEDATVALYWVTSPKINYWSGAKISKAYFQSEEGKVLPRNCGLDAFFRMESLLKMKKW